MIKKFSEFVEESTLWGRSFDRGVANGVRKEDDPSKDIVDFMERHNIVKYTINKDFTVDVNGNVIIEEKDVVNGKLPFRFGKVSGYFDCSDNELTSLEGCPKEVGGYFNCRKNQLTSLAGCPETVGGDFDCSDNELTSLVGSPEIVCGYFNCDYNELTSLDGSPEKVGDFFACDNNKLTSLEGCPKESVDFYCGGNKKQFTEEDVKSLCDIKGKIYCL